MPEWYFVLGLLIAVAVIAFTIIYVRIKKSESGDHSVRNEHDDVKTETRGESKSSTATNQTPRHNEG